MALKDGDIITLDYEGRTVGVLFDTTLEKVAKKEDSIVENRVYAPITVVVGDGRLVPGLENDLKKAKVGKTTEVTIAPEEAYGPRDTKLIETMSVSKFRRLCPNAKGFVGEEVNIEGKTGFLSKVGDIDKMAADMIVLLEDQELLTNFKMNALEHAKSFSLANILPKYNAIYQSL